MGSDLRSSVRHLHWERKVVVTDDAWNGASLFTIERIPEELARQHGAVASRDEKLDRMHEHDGDPPPSFDR